jgi:hypothetical protein
MKPTISALVAFVSTLFRSRLGCNSRTSHHDISALSISEEPNAHGLARISHLAAQPPGEKCGLVPVIVFSGRGFRVTGRGGVIL